jgi:magnesium-transporting ATPase (P-type)
MLQTLRTHQLLPFNFIILAYVIYRVAASIVLVLSLSIIIFVTGCSVPSLYIIILALLNDVSMIPVAYDNAKATTKPQLPRARSLVMQSLFYGIMNAFLTLMFMFTMNYDTYLFQDIELHQCTEETKAFIWLQLVFTTELMIFSVRAPGFFLLSMPSWKLIVSVIGTCGIGVIIAMFSADFKLAGENVGWIVLFNVASLIVVDILKVQFRILIKEEPGETIDTDELLKAPKKTETQKKVEKDMRYVVHNESIMPKEDREHVVEVKRRRSRSSLAGFFDIGTEFVLNDGFVQGHGSVYRRNLAPIPEGRVKQMSSPY